MKTQRRWTRWLRRLLLYPVLTLVVLAVGAITFITLTEYSQEDAPEAPLVLTGATVLVGEGLEPQTDTTVVVADGVISDVGPAGEVDIPDNAEVVDLEGHTLLPGLIDMHVHLSAPEIEPGEDFEFGVQTMARSIIDGARYAPNQRQAMIEHGVTTFRSLGDDGTWIVDLRERVNNGDLEGPRVFAAGPLFTTPGGHPVQTIHGGEVIDGTVEVPATPEEGRQAVADLATTGGGVDAIKVVQERGVEDVPLEPVDTEVLDAIVDEAGAYDRPVVGHWGSHADLEELLDAGVDGLEHFQLREEMMEAWPEGELEAITESGIHLGPTLAVMEAGIQGWGDHEWEQVGARFGELHDADVQIVASSDAPMNGLGFGSGLHRELELLVEFGLTPQEALQAATSTAAEALRTDVIGAIEPGRAADLLAVDGDPLDDISVISGVHRVWRDGRPVVGAEDDL